MTRERGKGRRGGGRGQGGGGQKGPRISAMHSGAWWARLGGGWLVDLAPAYNNGQIPAGAGIGPFFATLNGRLYRSLEFIIDR